MADIVELQRDSKGYVRFTEPPRMDERQFAEFIEQLWVKAQIDVKKRQLDVEFDEYDQAHGGIGKRRGPSRPWTDDEMKVLLKHPEEDHGVVGDRIGRSYMAVLMRRGSLLKEFEEWNESEEGKKHVGKTLAERVDAFFKS